MYSPKRGPKTLPFAYNWRQDTIATMRVDGQDEHETVPNTESSATENLEKLHLLPLAIKIQ